MKYPPISRFPPAPLVLFVAAALSSCTVRDIGVPLTPRTRVTFASVAEGAAVVGAQDEFVRAQSPFDRASRVKRNGPVSLQEFLEHSQQQCAAWSDEEKRTLERAIAQIAPRLEGLTLDLPERVVLVKTEVAQEAGAPHTRGASIVLPGGARGSNADSLERLLAHELFHVLSRNSPSTRAALYRVVGFELCDDVTIPTELALRKLTNPDAPRLACQAEIEHEGQTLHITPLLLSKASSYDEKAGGPFFQYLDFKLLVIEEQGGRWRAALKSGQPWLLDPAATPGYHEKIGRNSGYVIHPEEVLADNFVLLLHGSSDVPTPRVLDGMRDVLRASRGAIETYDPRHTPEAVR